MSRFPLYEILKNDKNIINITSEKKEEIINLIEKDKTCHEIVYVLIKTYQIDNDINEKLPYQCKHQKDKYKFNINKLPENLQIILYKFTQKRKIEFNRENELSKLNV